jgi:RNA-binding protein
MTQTLTPTSPTLTSRQKQYLKGLAHSLRPLVFIGKEGLSPAVIMAAQAELAHHELIKIKIGNNSGLERKATCQEIVELCGGYLIQIIGKTIVLYKPNEEKKPETRINLPRK